MLEICLLAVGSLVNNSGNQACSDSDLKQNSYDNSSPLPIKYCMKIQHADPNLVETALSIGTVKAAQVAQQCFASALNPFVIEWALMMQPRASGRPTVRPAPTFLALRLFAKLNKTFSSLSICQRKRRLTMSRGQPDDHGRPIFCVSEEKFHSLQSSSSGAAKMELSHLPNASRLAYETVAGEPLLCVPKIPYGNAMPSAANIVRDLCNEVHFNSSIEMMSQTELPYLGFKRHSDDQVHTKRDFQYIFATPDDFGSDVDDGPSCTDEDEHKKNVDKHVELHSKMEAYVKENKLYYVIFNSKNV
eukprot:IDg1951t1